MANNKKGVPAQPSDSTSTNKLTTDSISQDALINQDYLSIFSKNAKTSNPPKKTRLSVIRDITQEVLETMVPDDLKNPTFVEGEVLSAVNAALDLENTLREAKSKWKLLDALLPSQIADILAYSYPLIKIAGADMAIDTSQDMIALYEFNGDNRGIYVSSDTKISKLIREYNYNISAYDIAEVLKILQELLPRKTVCTKPNLVAVNNGIFDYDTKQLLPFSPDYIFIAKSKVNYNPNATNVVIHNDDDNTDWDIESWMADLSDDPAIVNTLWEILGAIIRPLVPWDKSAWFYSEQGNNGKGTLCELMRQLCGTGSYASIPLSDFSKDFMLEPLTRVTSIIVDENDVGTFIDKAANLKAVITNDVIQINRKFKVPIAYRFHGFMVQCLNEMPRIKDKSNSFYRRQLFIPFTKCFTGKERKYIKHDYLHRQEVLEYVLYRVLNMNYYDLSTPDSCKDALNDLKAANNPVIQFMDELDAMYPHGSGFVAFDKVPTKLLFDMFHNWFESNNKSKSSIQSSTFNKQIDDWVISHSDEWQYVVGNVRFRKLKNVDMSVFRDFNPGNNWIKYENNNMVYCPASVGSKNYIVYIGVVQSKLDFIQDLREKIDEYAKTDSLFVEYLDAEKRYEKYDAEFQKSGVVNSDLPKSYPYKLSFEMWLSYNNYDITDARDDVSRWKNAVEDADRKEV